MGIGSVTASAYQVAYRGYEASGNAKIDALYSNMSSAVEKSETNGTEKVLGLTMLPYSDKMSYGMVATYSETSTEEEPVIRVSSNYGGEKRYYDVHVNEVNPRNASQLEMFALSCYTDDKEITERGTFGSYSKMKSFGGNASYLGGFPDVQDPANANTKMDWISMLKQMAQVYSAIPETYEQSLDANRFADSLTKWKENIYYKIMNGETEEKIQIGGQALTQKEWNQLLKKFDTAEKVLQEKVKAEVEEKIDEKKTSIEESKIQSEMLTSNSVTSVTNNQDDEKVMHITWITDEGIFCRKAGQTEGYEWSISFDKKGQYKMAEQLLNALNEETYKYAADKTFLDKYFNGDITIEELVA